MPEKIKWDMKARLDKLKELERCYPDVTKARKIMRYIVAIINDEEAEKNLKELEDFLLMEHLKPIQEKLRSNEYSYLREK